MVTDKSSSEPTDGDPPSLIPPSDPGCFDGDKELDEYGYLSSPPLTKDPTPASASRTGTWEVFGGEGDARSVP